METKDCLICKISFKEKRPDSAPDRYIHKNWTHQRFNKGSRWVEN